MPSFMWRCNNPKRTCLLQSFDTVKMLNKHGQKRYNIPKIEKRDIYRSTKYFYLLSFLKKKKGKWI